MLMPRRQGRLPCRTSACGSAAPAGEHRTRPRQQGRRAGTGPARLGELTASQNSQPEQPARTASQQHRDFVAALLEEHGIPADGPAGQSKLPTSVSISDEAGEQLLDVAFRHPIKLIASALGTPPAFMIDRARQAGVPIAALVGAKEHAIKQVNAGVDILVAAGTEAGGHCGEVTTLVLVPELSEPVMRRIDVLAEQGNKGAQELATYWVGQGVGLMNKATTVRDVIYEMAEDFAEAAERLAAAVAE